MLASGDKVIAHVQAGGVDVITLDHTLVGETGLDIMARLVTIYVPAISILRSLPMSKLFPSRKTSISRIYIIQIG